MGTACRPLHAGISAWKATEWSWCCDGAARTSARAGLRAAADRAIARRVGQPGGRAARHPGAPRLCRLRRTGGEMRHLASTSRRIIFWQSPFASPLRLLQNSWGPARECPDQEGIETLRVPLCSHLRRENPAPGRAISAVHGPNWRTQFAGTGLVTCRSRPSPGSPRRHAPRGIFIGAWGGHSRGDCIRVAPSPELRRPPP
jgi:hypothetical protein